MSGIENVEATEWREWAEENDAILLDIRQPEEWELGTLPHATLIPMTEIMNRVGEIPLGRPILCICRSGGRSQQVATFLLASGFERVANMVGGMKALGLQD